MLARRLLLIIESTPLHRCFNLHFKNFHRIAAKTGGSFLFNPRKMGLFSAQSDYHGWTHGYSLTPYESNYQLCRQFEQGRKKGNNQVTSFYCPSLERASALPHHQTKETQVERVIQANVYHIESQIIIIHVRLVVSILTIIHHTLLVTVDDSL